MNSLRVFSGSACNSVQRKALWVLGVVFCLLLASSPMFAQGSSGRIMGTITDQSGGVISGATVTVLDAERGVSKILITNDAGEYNAPNLTPSTYKVRAESKGFSAIERANIVLEVGKEIRVDLTMQPGAQEQTVTVTEAVPLVETTNATLGGTLDNADINDMPLNGRNYQSLLSLRPGVAVQPGGGPWTQSTNGVRPDESMWMVEGVINVNFYDARPIANMPSPFTDGATILPIDAIQEFNLAGKPQGGIWLEARRRRERRAQIRHQHFSRNGLRVWTQRSWSARNAFNPAPDSMVFARNPTPGACDKPPTHLKQFGGVVGGPIKKDKLFFMGGYEGLRSFVGNLWPAKYSHNCRTGKLQFKATTNSMVNAINAIGSVNPALLSPVSLSLACQCKGSDVSFACEFCMSGSCNRSSRHLADQCKHFASSTPASFPTAIKATTGSGRSITTSTIRTRCTDLL